jgi:branched-chain amino acid aminotransferase
MLQNYDLRNARILIHVGGRLMAREFAAISPFDSAVQGGDAVWEGLRLYRGRIFRLDQHLARLERSAKALAFATIPSRDHMVAAITRTLAANRMYDGVHVRLTLTRGRKVTSGMDPRLNREGPTLIVLAEWKPPVYGARPIALTTSSIRRPSPDVLDPKIHHANLLGSILAKIEASNAGGDDALMLDSRGFVAETNATHAFAVAEGRLLTPRTIACPEGITRAAVLELARELGIGSEERDVSLAEFHRADEVFCTGTMGELVPVARIDGRKIGDAAPGEVTQRLRAAFSELVAREGVRVVADLEESGE